MKKLSKLFFPRYVAIVTILLIFATTVQAQLSIGSFNLKHLGGQGIKNYEKIANIIDKEGLSIVALQEISSHNGVRELVNNLGNGWEYNVTEEPCNGECLAFIWKGDKKLALESTTLWQKNTPLKRPPYIAEFRNGTRIFWFVNVHIVHGTTVGERELEIDELKRIYISVDRTIGYTIILGDFNLDSKKINSKNLPFKSYQDEKTTLRKAENGYTNSYDHFCFNEDVLSELKPKCYVIKAPEKYYKGNFTKYQQEVSDHVPIRMDIDKNTNLLVKGKDALKGLISIVKSK